MRIHGYVSGSPNYSVSGRQCKALSVLRFRIEVETGLERSIYCRDIGPLSGTHSFTHHIKLKNNYRIMSASKFNIKNFNVFQQNLVLYHA
jgi:hypothetical protein